MVILPLSDFIDSNEAIADRPISDYLEVQSHRYFNYGINPKSQIQNLKSVDSSVNYWYEGHCPQTGELLRLPRTGFVEAIARGLMRQLASDRRYSYEGKMYGILLVELPSGEQGIIKAFSGLLNGCSEIAGWVPPISGRDLVGLDEARTLAELETIKQEIIRLKSLPERQQYQSLAREFEEKLKEISDRHQNRQQQRHQKRQQLGKNLTAEALKNALEALNEESRSDGIERKRFKRQRDEILQPLKQAIARSDKQITELKQQRKEISRQLQTQMHAAYSLMNFWGTSRSLQELMPQGLPTGTGDCCAPKLLHYAATHDLKPLAMAEFWWGSSLNNGDKIQGEFYGACIERCQPLMGFLLSGLEQKYRENKQTPHQAINSSPSPSSLVQPGNKSAQIYPQSVLTDFRYETGVLTPGGIGGIDEITGTIIYEDKWLIIINKPAGLLSVPGRYFDTQDSALSRLRHLLPDGKSLTAVHRLDRETSGILLLARDLETYRHLSQQFAKRQVKKVYEAIATGTLTIDAGTIELPLWGDPDRRPYQQVHWQKGKPSTTYFKTLKPEGNYTRVEFIPLTGRTHQLRVHAADAKGLNAPILGDKLYGCDAVASRLHLHARELWFEHPHLGERLHIKVETPF